MARNAVGSSPKNGRPVQAMRRNVALVVLLLAPALSGCETMERMDYLDRFFDPALRARSVAGMEPVRNPGDPAPTANGGFQQASVVAMEPVRGAGDAFPAADWNPEPASVVAMEPVRSAGDQNTRTASLRAAEPPMDAETRTRLLVRQNPWLTRFWMELTPAQQARVERRLRRGNVSPASGQADPAAAAWDPMGLADRARLVFGGSAPLERPGLAETGDAATLAAGP
jgi:hypothetical protein